MKISLIQEHLAKALLHINKAVSTRPNIPVLANVLLETEKGKLKLSATNLEIGISTWIGATVAEEGSLTVSAKMLSDFVNSLGAGKLDMIMDGQKLVVKSVDNNADFYIIPADDFPQVPEIEGEPIMEIKAVDFADAVSRTAFAAGTDESRPVLTGLLMEAEESELTLVAVDGFRLSRKLITLSEPVKENLSEIVPARALIEVERLISDAVEEDSDETLKIYLMESKNQMLFKIGDLQLSTRLIEGKFPDYKQILPEDKKLNFKVDRKQLAATIKVVSIFARNVVGNKARIQIDTTEDKLKMRANVVDVGSNESSVDITDVEGADMETGYNVKFLSDMLSAIKSTQIQFETNGPTAPGVFLDTDDANFVHVVMPMKLD